MIDPGSTSSEHEEWLAGWNAAERFPLTEAEAEAAGDARVRRVFEAVRGGGALLFFYLGGELGVIWDERRGMLRAPPLRQVRPRTLFRAKGFSGIYFEGWCDLRGEMRVFRVDRCEFWEAERV